MNPYKGKDLKKFIDSIPQEEVEKQTRLQEEDNQRVYKEFVEKLNENKCFLCGSRMDLFDEARPCFHWFTYPSGIKKRYFKNYLTNPLSFFRLDCYFRWLANTEKPIGNINDLKDETSRTSYLETTIKYKNIEWAFSIGFTDKEGHINSYKGNMAHYHIQMKVDGRIFIKFNDFHVLFTDEDLFTFELLEQAGDKVKLAHFYGQGIGIIEDEENLPLIDKALTISDDEETAPFRRQTFIEAPKGKTIPGDLIIKAMEESKRTKEPVGRILQKYLKDAKFTTIIEPGDGIPNMTKRNGKR